VHRIERSQRGRHEGRPWDVLSVERDLPAPLSDEYGGGRRIPSAHKLWWMGSKCRKWQKQVKVIQTRYWCSRSTLQLLRRDSKRTLSTLSALGAHSPTVLLYYCLHWLHLEPTHLLFRERNAGSEIPSGYSECREWKIQVSTCMDLGQLLHWEPPHLVLYYY
jgi:hypothetical protein